MKAGVREVRARGRAAAAATEVSPGRDPLLALLCLLVRRPEEKRGDRREENEEGSLQRLAEAVLLLSPELSGLGH